MNRPAIYSRPDKPLTIPVTRRRGIESLENRSEMVEPLTVDKATECHVTPDDVARRMVDYLGPQGDYMTLEPSAGTGQLVRALLASGHSPCELCVIERHVELFRSLYRVDGIRGAGILNQCFLEYAAEARGKVWFPRVIMNPPFRKTRQHVAAALSLLGRNGHDVATLVALVPVTFDHPDAEELETLGQDTFATARVNTKLVRICK